MSAIAEIEKAVPDLPLEQDVLPDESLLGWLPPLGEIWSEAEEMAEMERREREIESGHVQILPEAEFWRRVQGRRNR